VSELLIASADVPAGAVVPIEIGDDEFVVWRASRSGRACVIARQCPHLDFDLADAFVVDDELVCSGHGWSFDTDGRACKRNLAGRADPKDEAVTLPIEERDGEIRVVQ
jgi:phenylpropionate dioxygenase-like ring-hydroxylating dioxygenase large terminal subunit